MGTPATAWLNIAGDGLVHSGLCLVKSIVFHPDTAADYADVYDGRDTVSGTKFCRIEAAVDGTVSLDLGDGVLFGKGIYIDGIDSAVETTVTFVPL